MWFLDWVLFNLCQFIYPLIPNLYEGIDKLARVDLFSGSGAEIRNNVWNNLYILLSVVILFAIAIKLINAIVNPDVLGEKKKGVKSLYFRAFISVFLVILLPIAFDTLKNVQDHILDNEIISKIIIGTRTEDGGQTLAKYTANAFVDFPDDSNNPLLTDKNIDVALEEMDTAEVHRYRDNGYVNKINTLLMLIAGVFIVYELIVIALDTAVRAIKLKVLELMVPIVLGGYMFKEEILKKWVIEYIKTFVQLFLLLVSIYLIAIILPLVREIVNEDAQYGWVIKTLLIFGLLTLARQIPNLINTIFGVNIKGKGGIRGRLGEMAAVGGLAQRAFDSLRQHPIQTGRRVLSAPISAIGGGAAHIGESMRAGMMRGGWRGALQAGAGILTAGGAAMRAGQQGWRNGNLQGIGAQYRRYQDTHLPDSTLHGRLIDTATSALGLGTREERQLERDKLIKHRDPITGQVREMTFDELQARQNVNKGFDDVRAAIRSQVETSIDREASQIEINDGTGHGIHFATKSGMKTLTGNAASIRKQLAAMENASAAELGVADAEEKAKLIAGLNAAFAQARNRTLDNAEDLIWAGGVNAQITQKDAQGNNVKRNILSTGADMAIIGNHLDHATDLVNDNADLGKLLGQDHDDGHGVITKSTVDTTGGQIRITDFRAGSRLNVSDEYNSINRDVNRHNDEIAARQSTETGREHHASGQSVNARNNNNGGNTGGNNH